MGPLGLGSPPSTVLCDATTATCPSRGPSLVARSPIPCVLPSVCGLPAGLVTWSKRPDNARAFGHPVPQSGNIVKEPGGSPKFPSSPCEDMPRSQTPVASCVSPKRTQDYCLPATGNRRLTTTLPISGLHPVACLLTTPGSVRPLTGRHAGSLLTCWRGFNQVGLEPKGSHPLGNNNQFHRISPTPKVSGLPWREQALVRHGLGTVSRLAFPCPQDVWEGCTIIRPRPRFSLQVDRWIVRFFS